MNTPTDAIRLAADFAQEGPCLVGFNPYACYLVEISSDQSFNGAGSVVLSKTRLTVADGYLSYAPGDGYLNPPVRQMSTEQLVLSGASLTDDMVILGPFVFPYQTTFKTGGTDPALFQPVSNNTNNQLYVLIQGIGLNASVGNYFNIKQIQLHNMNDISYLVLLEATSYVPST